MPGIPYARKKARAAFEGCEAFHLPPPAEDPDHLPWFEVAAPYERARVMSATCWRCPKVSYELLARGGAYLIRRTDVSGLRPSVHETPAERHQVVDGWWQALMHGRAV